MIQQSQKSTQCLFCTTLTTENKHVFFILYKIMSKELQNLQNLSQNINTQGYENQCHGWRQLLKIIFNLNRNVAAQHICGHQKYYTYFKKKLRCSCSMFNIICQRLSEKMAEKKYHLQLLQAQIKNSAKSILNGKVTKQKPKQEKKASFQKQTFIDIVIEIDPLKYTEQVQNEQLKDPFVSNNIYQSVTSMPGSSMSFISTQNSEYSIYDPQSNLNLTNFGLYYPYQIYCSPPRLMK